MNGILSSMKRRQALKAAQIGGKLLSVPALQAEYEQLQAQKESRYADYGKLKKQVQEYNAIKRNIETAFYRQRSSRNICGK